MQLYLLKTWKVEEKYKHQTVVVGHKDDFPTIKE